MENKSFEIKGLKELQEAIRQLPAKLQAKLISGFLKKAGKKHITDGLKQKLSYSSKLESSIKVVGDKDPLKVHYILLRTQLYIQVLRSHYSEHHLNEHIH